jgi:hypothetical protein
MHRPIVRVRREINTSHRGGRGARLARHEEGETIDVFNRRVTPPGGLDRLPNAGVISRRAPTTSLDVSPFLFLSTKRLRCILLLNPHISPIPCYAQRKVVRNTGPMFVCNVGFISVALLYISQGIIILLNRDSKCYDNIKAEEPYVLSSANVVFRLC